MADNLFARIVQAASDLDRNFILPPGRAAISYGEAFAMAARFAHVLARHGVKPGDRVAVQVEKSAAALFLSDRIGATFDALVTGASGFVGWHVARILRERGIPVRALCREA